MKLMKKSGKIVDFDPSKIITSIENSANDIEISLNSRDVELLLEDITDSLKLLAREDNYSSSYEVRSLIVDVLTKNGYKNIAKAYVLNTF